MQPERDGVKSVCYDVAFKPGITQIPLHADFQGVLLHALDFFGRLAVQNLDKKSA